MWQNQQITQNEIFSFLLSLFIKVYHQGNHTVDLDSFFSLGFTLNKSSHSLKHRGFSENIYIGYTHIYNVQYF